MQRECGLVRVAVVAERHAADVFHVVRRTVSREGRGHRATERRHAAIGLSLANRAEVPIHATPNGPRPSWRTRGRRNPRGPPCFRSTHRRRPERPTGLRGSCRYRQTQGQAAASSRCWSCRWACCSHRTNRTRSCRRRMRRLRPLAELREEVRALLRRRLRDGTRRRDGTRKRRAHGSRAARLRESLRAAACASRDLLRAGRARRLRSAHRGFGRGVEAETSDSAREPETRFRLDVLAEDEPSGNADGAPQSPLFVGLEGCCPE